MSNLSYASFVEAAKAVTRQRVASADVPQGQWSIDVAATVRHLGEEWWKNGKSPEELVEYVMLMPQAELTKSEFRLPGH